MTRVCVAASWYPSAADPADGIFIRRHAECLALAHDTAVVHVRVADEPAPIALVDSGGILTAVATVTRGPGSLASLTLGREYRRAASRALNLLIREWGRFDVLNVQVAHPAGVITTLEEAKNTPYFITEHASDYLFESGLYDRRRPWTKMLNRRVFARAAHVTAVSEYLGRALVARRLAAAFQVVPNVVCAASQSSRANAGTFEFGWIGRLEDTSKNVTGLVDAMELLVREREDWQMTIVGDGPARPAIEGRLEASGLSARVRLLGRVAPDQVQQAIASVSCVVVSSNFETFSVSAAEALASGRPVLSTRCGGPEEFVGSDDGILVDRSDPAALATGMSEMIDRVGSFDSESIVSRARERFGVEAVTNRLAEAVHTALAS